MATAPSTTWKLVTMMPSDRITNPVPTPFPCAAPPSGLACTIDVVTLATAGATRLTTWTTGSWATSVGGSDEGVGRVGALPAPRPDVEAAPGGDEVVHADSTIAPAKARELIHGA